MASEIYARKKEIFNELVTSQMIPLRPGVNYIVDEAIAAGVKLAVCSSSDDRAVESVVNLMGQARASHVRVFAAGSITRPKPDPQVYTLAAAALGVPPEDCVAIEDSRAGLLAAKAAGIACIVVPSGYTARQDFALADLVVAGLNELDLDTVVCQARSTQFHLAGRPLLSPRRPGPRGAPGRARLRGKPLCVRARRGRCSRVRAACGDTGAPVQLGASGRPRRLGRNDCGCISAAARYRVRPVLARLLPLSLRCAGPGGMGSNFLKAELTGRLAREDCETSRIIEDILPVQILRAAAAGRR